MHKKRLPMKSMNLLLKWNVIEILVMEYYIVRKQTNLYQINYLNWPITLMYQLIIYLE